MKLVDFRVQMYKCFVDSGWVEVSPLTVLVGKNESGKTSLLKALHKFNPFRPEPYSMDREWPRGKRDVRNDQQIVCTTHFELEDSEKQQLATLLGREVQAKSIEFCRNYAGQVRVASPTDLLLEAIPAEEAAARKQACDYLISRLPTFIYMSDYRAFTGSAQLDQVKQRKDRNQLSEEDRTLLMIMELSGLNLDKEVEAGNLPDREQRQYDIDDASATLTQTISDRWKQRRYEAQFRADGQLFYTFVKDERDPSLIRLEERSKGFQWFFSFDLMFMYESRGTFKGCVILLDEPGLHLHPDAQRDLLKRMEEYARDNLLLYTTHLPFMIDLAKPERIRVLSETTEGNVVSDDLTKAQPEAKFVLQAALGMSGSTSYLLSKRNLVVEGVDDYWIISELSSLFKRAGESAIPEDVFITPAGGASEAAYITTFMIGQKLGVAVLLDSDRAGQDARDALVKKWLTRYQDHSARVLSLGEVVGVSGRDFAIEDIFPEDFYLERVKQVYKKELAAAGVEKIELKGSDQLCKRVERSLEPLGIKFNKGSVAKVIRADLSHLKDLGELPEPTKGMARKLIAAVASSLPEVSA
jgi:predicted ATP-dependent endonuclease of OLD family